MIINLERYRYISFINYIIFFIGRQFLRCEYFMVADIIFVVCFIFAVLTSAYGIRMFFKTKKERGEKMGENRIIIIWMLSNIVISLLIPIYFLFLREV